MQETFRTEISQPWGASLSAYGTFRQGKSPISLRTLHPRRNLHATGANSVHALSLIRNESRTGVHQYQARGSTDWTTVSEGVIICQFPRHVPTEHKNVCHEEKCRFFSMKLSSAIYWNFSLFNLIHLLFCQNKNLIHVSIKLINAFIICSL